VSPRAFGGTREPTDIGLIERGYGALVLSLYWYEGPNFRLIPPKPLGGFPLILTGLGIGLGHVKRLREERLAQVEKTQPGKAGLLESLSMDVLFL
jgi:hypothetical protein